MIPSPRLAATVAAATLPWALACALLAARLRRRGVPTPYTRKVFHFTIFTGAGLVHAMAGLTATNVYGAVVAAVVLAAVVRGDGTAFYEALARPTDRPRRSFFILVPLLTTALGGLASALLTGPFATVGYLVGGWGDAVGEPVGTRWGRHPYRVPSLAGVPARRTLEGSAAVLVVGTGAAWVALAVIGVGGWSAVSTAVACGVVGAGVEAVSHHGTDNLTVQLASSLVALWILG